MPKRARRKAARRRKATKSARKAAPTRRSGKRPSKRTAKRAARPKAARTRPRPASARRSATSHGQARRAEARRRLDRPRRTLEETVPTPPSSLNLDRRGSSARTGRAELASNLRKHGAMTPALTGGDVDADWEDAYFTGEEAPGGDNPTPDQDVVEDIGKALGVEYADNEELKAADKLAERDKHRWELDPASSEDYKDRK